MLINGKEYEFAQMTMISGGRDVIGFRGANYGFDYEREHLHAKGNKPHSIQSGNSIPSGDITITQSELEGMQRAGGGSIYELQYDIVFAYGNPSKGERIQIDIVKGAVFQGERKGMAQGAKFMDITLNFLALDIEFGRQ